MFCEPDNVNSSVRQKSVSYFFLLMEHVDTHCACETIRSDLTPTQIGAICRRGEGERVN